MEPIVIVDKDDNIIGHKKWQDETVDDITRISALWIENSRGQILLARRALNKKYDPGKWGPAVAGTLEKNETYYSNIIKETEEEIGLTQISPTPGPKLFVRNNDRNFFAQYYTLKLDRDITDFIIQKDEVMDIKWWDKPELEKRIKTHPEEFTPTLSEIMQHQSNENN